MPARTHAAPAHLVPHPPAEQPTHAPAPCRVLPQAPGQGRASARPSSRPGRAAWPSSRPGRAGQGLPHAHAPRPQLPRLTRACQRPARTERPSRTAPLASCPSWSHPHALPAGLPACPACLPTRLSCLPALPACPACRPTCLPACPKSRPSSLPPADLVRAGPGPSWLPASPRPASELVACLALAYARDGFLPCLGQHSSWLPALPRPMISQAPSELPGPRMAELLGLRVVKLFDHHPTESWARSLQLPRLRKLCTRTVLTTHYPQLPNTWQSLTTKVVLSH